MIQQFQVIDIIPNPDQPRKSIRKIDELADSMAEIGQLVPISLRKILDEERTKIKTKAHYMLANGGERRWTAAKKLGWKTIKGVIENPDPYAMLAENVARDELCVIEIMDGVSNIFEKKVGKDWKTILGHFHNYPHAKRSREELILEKACKSIGLKPITVYLYSRVSHLHPAIKKTILENLDYFSNATILKMCCLKEEKSQAVVAKKIVEDKLTFSQATKVISSEYNRTSFRPMSADEVAWEEMFTTWKRNSLGVQNCLSDALDLKKPDLDDLPDFLSRVEKIKKLSELVIKKFEKVKA